MRTVMVLVALALPAYAMGPVADVGGVVTLRESVTSSGGQQVGFNHLAGPVARVGFELGDRFNHELAFQWSWASGTGSALGTSMPVSVTTYAGRYTFSVDFFTKEGLDAFPGFTPTLGVGVSAGTAQVQASTEQRWVPYLELHAVAGARYTLKSGWNFKLEVVGSTYGGFFALQPSLSAGYQF